MHTDYLNLAKNVLEYLESLLLMFSDNFVTWIPSRTFSVKHRYFSKIVYISADTVAIILRFADVPLSKNIFGENRILAVSCAKRRYCRLFLRKRMLLNYNNVVRISVFAKSNRCPRLFEIKYQLT